MRGLDTEQAVELPKVICELRTTDGDMTSSNPKQGF